MSVDTFLQIHLKKAVSDSYKEVLKFDAVPKNLVMYPIKKDHKPVKKDSNGFVENHGGATMKNSRQQMVYKQHMELCVGELADTLATKKRMESAGTKKDIGIMVVVSSETNLLKIKVFIQKMKNPTRRL